MPHSTVIFKKEIKDFVESKFNKTSSVLDIGCGAGAYADMFKAHFFNMDAIEVFEPYVEMFKLKSKYTNLFIQDCLTFDFRYYDLILFGDVLEHIEESKGIEFIKKIYSKCNDLIIGVPFNSTQGVHFDNTYEIHLQTGLTNESFLAKYEGFRPLCIRYDYGIYIKNNEANKNVSITVDPTNIEFKVVSEELSSIYGVEVIDYSQLPHIKGEVPAVKADVEVVKDKLTVVTGLWNIGRSERDFEAHYLANFRLLLDAPCNLFILIEAKYEHVVWEKRDKSNTFVKIWELSDIKDNIYKPHWDKTQEIRNSTAWQNITGEGGWLKTSPQAILEYYNPVVMSKMLFMHSVTIWNPFDSKYFLWLDAGLTTTVNHGWLIDPIFYKRITNYIDPFLFVSFDYENYEMHGLRQAKMDEYAGSHVTHVCRGGLFGGTKKAIHQAHAQYYGLLQLSLSQNEMGTEESLFAIMSYLRPNYFRRFELGGSIIGDFVERVINRPETISITGENLLNKEYHEDKDRTSIYFLTFNKPKQVEKTILHLKKSAPEWLDIKHKFIIDNSTDEEAKAGNLEVAARHGFVLFHMEKNIGISGGRQFVAEHFDTLDADYYVFFEDDMTVNGIDQKDEFCRNNLRKYVPNLWNVIHGIITKDKLHYLKLTFTEVHMDNYEQVSWYNIEQDLRTRLWPQNDRLPVHGLDSNSPRMRYDYLDHFEGFLYGIGDVYYCNWPALFSKEGNRRVFLETKIALSERNHMAHVFKLQLDGYIKAGVLLASPITHDRVEFYKNEDRIEG